MNDRPKILSIDDNDGNQKLIEKALGGSYDLAIAMSGSSGIEVLSRFKPDAILLDIDLPYLDGLRLCRMIRAEPSFNNTPILLVSAAESPQEQVSGYQAGGDDYIIMPLNMEQLKEKLDQSLKRAKAKVAELAASNDVPALDQAVQRLLDALTGLIPLASADEIGEHVLATLDSLGLKGAVYLHQGGRIFSSVGPLSDLEELLLQQAKHPYPSEFSARYLWGSSTIGAIVQNMPHARYDHYQPLTQLIASLLNGADQKLQTLPEHRQSAERGAARITDREVDLRSLHVYRYKLENALEHLEQRSEEQLSHLCKQLQILARSPTLAGAEAQQLLKLADIGLAARLTVYDQCLEIQSHFNHINHLIELGDAS